jgi:hypothetical protein
VSVDRRHREPLFDIHPATGANIEIGSSSRKLWQRWRWVVLACVPGVVSRRIVRQLVLLPYEATQPYRSVLLSPDSNRCPPKRAQLQG